MTEKPKPRDNEAEVPDFNPLDFSEDLMNRYHFKTPEDSQKTKGFKKIKARYQSTCYFCRQQVPSKSEIYWKRETNDDGSYRTTTICLNCWLNKMNPAPKQQQEENTPKSTLTFGNYLKKE